MSDRPESDLVDLHVSGSPLAFHRWGTGPDVVVALHGITANGLSYLPLADRLREFATVIAPDLRGRAGSRAVTEPAGLGVHADDVIELLDALGLDRVVLVGHSMGAFVAALAGARHPERFRHIVLVDGGVAFPLPAQSGPDIDALLTATIGPAMERLSMTFASPQDYLDFWQPHPALSAILAGPQGPDLLAYLRHDLVPDGAGGFRSSCDLDVIRTDGAGVLVDPEVQAAVVAGSVPTTLLWAELGMLDQRPGMLTDAAIAAADLPPSVRTAEVPGSNHYSILLTDPGLSALVDAIQAALTVTP